MSWSFHAIGKAAAVAAKAQTDLAACANSCAEPEKSLILKSADLVAAALAPWPSDQAVKVSGNGSQYLIKPAVLPFAAIPAVAAVAADPLAVPPVEGVAAVEGKPAVDAVAAVASNTFNLSIEPLYGFVE